MISFAAMKTKVTGTIVEILGDEMTRIIWALVKERLVLPFAGLITLAA